MYVDGFVFAVPKDQKDAFRKQAREAAAVFLDHGATRVVENWGDDVPEGKLNSFHTAVHRKEGEAVLFSWIEYPDKATRDTCNKAAMEDPRFKDQDMSDMLFIGETMIYGGFETVFERRRTA